MSVLESGDPRCGSCGKKPSKEICRRCFERERFEEMGEDYN